MIRGRRLGKKDWLQLALLPTLDFHEIEGFDGRFESVKELLVLLREMPAQGSEKLNRLPSKKREVAAIDFP